MTEVRMENRENQPPLVDGLLRAIEQTRLCRTCALNLFARLRENVDGFEVHIEATYGGVKK